MVGAVTRQHVGGDVRYEFFEVNFRGYVHGEDSLNLADDLADDILKVISIAGMKYYNELKGEFDE